MRIAAYAARIGVALPFALAAVAAHATPVPPSVAAMIDAADSDPATLKTISDLAKKTNPDSAAEIDAQVAQITAANEAARVQKLETQKFTEGWTGEGSLGAFASSGNTSSSGVALGLTLTKESLRWKNTFGAGVNYQKDNGVTSQERYFIGNKLDYKFSERFYVYGLLGWERDTFAGYDSRFSESIGLGYKLIATPKVTLGLEAGPALRQTSYTDDTSDSVFNGRVAGNFLWNIGPTTTFTEVASYFFGEGGDTFTSDTALTTKLYGKLSARISFFIQNESEPQPGREATDTTTRVTLVYGF